MFLCTYEDDGYWMPCVLQSMDCEECPYYEELETSENAQQQFEKWVDEYCDSIPTQNTPPRGLRAQIDFL